MKHTSYIELSHSTLKKNIRYLQKRIGPKVKFVSVIKGNAYGHGIERFVPLAEECDIDYFAVFDAVEAKIAHKVKQEQSKLMIMGMISGSDIKWAIKNNISFFVFNFDRLQEAAMYAKSLNTPAHIHIEVETGLHRTGFEHPELEEVIKFINNRPSLFFIEGLCTHYAGAESIANYYRIQQQIKRFLEIKRWLQHKGVTPRYCHTACSSAALNYPETRMDMVRLGIAQYGFWPNTETKMHNLLSDNTKFTKDPLQQILSWKSQVMSVKTIPPGEFVGYGNYYQTTRTTKIATIPIGYYHGYRRSLSNIGHVLIHGRKARVIGLVNMSIMIVDISNIPRVTPGDEVVLIGKQGKHKISVVSFSEMSNLVNYELLVRLPHTIPRIITE